MAPKKARSAAAKGNRKSAKGRPVSKAAAPKTAAKISAKKNTRSKNTAAKPAAKKPTDKKAEKRAEKKLAEKTTSDRALGNVVKPGLATKPLAAEVRRSKTTTASGRERVALKRPAKPAAKKPTPAPAPVEELLTPEQIASPPLEVLKPFREAAKANRRLQVQRRRSQAKKSAFLAKGPKRGKKYTLDLRVHSPGSIGFYSTGGVDPAPALVRLAKVKGLNIVGLTDYYNASYVDQVKEIARDSGLTIIPGLDLRCRIGECNEVSLIALFPETHTSADIFAVLDALQVPPQAYGRNDYVIDLPFEQVLEAIESRQGVLIPSRVDKTPFRHLAIPAMVEKYGIHAFDLVHPDNPEVFREQWPEGGFTFFSFSNANALGQIGSRTAKLRLSAPGFEGIRELVARRVQENKREDQTA